MEEVKNKSIKLTAYVIDNDEIGKKYSSLYDNLVVKLSQNQDADARRMKLNEKSSEEDLLSDFAVRSNSVYGVMWRIVPSNELPKIPSDFFKQTTISRDALNEKKKEEDQSENKQEKDNAVKELACKSTHYFVLNQHYLVSDLPLSRIKSLQVYLNWLLTPYKTDDVIYSFTPKVKSTGNIYLRDIKSIVIGDNTTLNVVPKKEQEDESQNNRDVAMKVLQVAQDKLMSMLSEDKYLKDIVDKNIVQAQLVLKIRKPKKKEETDYENILGTTMKPIADTDGITFQLKNGKLVKGSTIMVTKDVDVELTSDGLISEKALMFELLAFLREL